MGAGLINIMRQGIGRTVGLAAMTTLLEHSTAYHHAVLEQPQGSSSLAWGEILAPVRALVPQAGEVGALAYVRVTRIVRLLGEERTA